MIAATREGPLKVLVAAQYLAPNVGGAERYALEVANRLAAKSDFSVSYLASDSQTGVSAPAMRLWTTGYHPAWPRQVRAALESLVPDVIYVHHTVPGLTDVVLRQAATRRIPVALMYHSDVTGPQWYKRWIGELYQAMIGKASLAVPDVIFVGSSTYASRSFVLSRMKIKGRVVEAPPGVDPVMRTGSRGAGRYLLFVGKPELKTKGVEVLVAAWRRLYKEWPDHELVIVGGRTCSSTDQYRVRHAGTASRLALADLYAGAEATILPSLVDESFGMVLAEALVAGSPIVASDFGGTPSLVENGRNGRLVPPGDVDALAAAIKEMLTHGAAYRRYVAQRKQEYGRRFAWETTAEIVAHALRGLVRGQAARLAAPKADA